MPITDDDLRRAFTSWPEFERLRGVVETEHEWRLGLLSVHKTEPVYRYGYSYSIAETSRFMKRRVGFADLGVSGFAVVFRQFDRARDPDDPPEFAIGWVPDDEEAALDMWIVALDAELRSRRDATRPGVPED